MRISLRTQDFPRRRSPKTTISRYFNDPDSLTLENQQKIADALTALDYKENKVGRILASGRTEFVGIIIPNLYMHYYSEMLNQILATYETYCICRERQG